MLGFGPDNQGFTCLLGLKNKLGIYKLLLTSGKFEKMSVLKYKNLMLI